MAGDGTPTTNNDHGQGFSKGHDGEAEAEEEGEEEEDREVREPHSRVGGIPEQDPPAMDPVSGGLCHYGARVVRSGTTFVEIFQVLALIPEPFKFTDALGRDDTGFMTWF